MTEMYTKKTPRLMQKSQEKQKKLAKLNGEIAADVCVCICVSASVTDTHTHTLDK